MKTLVVATSADDHTRRLYAADAGDAALRVLAVPSHGALFALANPHVDVTYIAEVGGSVRVVNDVGETVQIVSTSGEAPCHLALDSTGRNLYCANYSGSSLTVFRVTLAGRIAQRMQHVALPYAGGDVRPARPHHILFVPGSTSEMLVADLGRDRILHYSVSVEGTLSNPIEVWRDRERTPGPRSMALDHLGHMWCADESTSTVSRLVGTEGSNVQWSRLVLTHRWPATRERSQGANHPGYFVSSPDGRNLYLANRGVDTISVFSSEDARLGPVQEVACGGKWPSSLVVIDNSLYVACRDSDVVTVHAIDPARGTLGRTHSIPGMVLPSALAVHGGS